MEDSAYFILSHCVFKLLQWKNTCYHSTVEDFAQIYFYFVTLCIQPFI